MKSLRILALTSLLATAAVAENKVELKTGDGMVDVLQRQVGQSVELRLKSGDKLAGKIETISGSLVHVSSLFGQEFYDAVVKVDDISAVVIRTRK